MDSNLTIANDYLEHLMAFLIGNNGLWQKHWLARIGLFAGTYLTFWKLFNPPGRAKRNVAHHYDLKDGLLTRSVNILAAIYIWPVTRLPMRKLPSWRALEQSYVYKFLDIASGWGALAKALWEP